MVGIGGAGDGPGGFERRQVLAQGSGVDAKARDDRLQGQRGAASRRMASAWSKVGRWSAAPGGRWPPESVCRGFDAHPEVAAICRTDKLWSLRLLKRRNI
jgi:hypothetical protein